MSALEKRYRRNFILAVVLHVGIIGGVVLLEQLPGFASRTETPIVIGDILGELPTGNGPGRGAYKAPEPTTGNSTPAPQNNLSSDERLAPEPKPAAPSKPDPTDIAIPKKQKPTPAVAVKPATQKKATTSTSQSSLKPNNNTSTAADIKRRFISKLTSSAGGTLGGDNKAAGGGTGKGGSIGSPGGSKDGVSGGVGQGTPDWQYKLHVHDMLYEAWGQPAAATQKGLTTTVLLRIARDGSIAESAVRIGSGNQLMDESVLAAVRKVARLDPPPDSLVRGTYATMTVDFQLEG